MRKMKINGNEYTVGERQFILYQFLRKNTRKCKAYYKTIKHRTENSVRCKFMWGVEGAAPYEGFSEKQKNPETFRFRGFWHALRDSNP